MNRRKFGLLAGGSLAALKVGALPARAASVDRSLLSTTLTPMGAERAGNADGSIPAWTGGLTTLPEGLTPQDYVPELFPDEQPVVVIDAGNMAQHADRLSEGVQAMMTKYGYKIKVYPTHRTAAASQFVYDSIAENATRASFLPADPVGGRFGIRGIYSGVPFPILDMSNPLTTGGQIIWNALTNWRGFCYTATVSAWSVSGGQKSMASTALCQYKYPLYDPNGSVDHFSGWQAKIAFHYTGPADLVGQALIGWGSVNPREQPTEAWVLENGEGRVRRAPEDTFDTPSSNSNDIANYDETKGFEGSPERYDWRYIGKKEMYIPYNNNALYAGPAAQAHLEHFLDPELVRWELHRCWIVEATLHPGERNVLARRRYYIDEDTWNIATGDAWDANENLFKVNILYNYCRPDLPGLAYGNNTVHNLQTDDYASTEGFWNEKTHPTLRFPRDLPDSAFDANNLAASAQY